MFAADEDPQLVREALPFALKTYEMLLQSTPEDPDLLLATCSGFVQYAKAFVEEDAFYAEAEDFARARALRLRARRLYLRARAYCVRALEATIGIGSADLIGDAESALSSAREQDVPALYWTGAAWGSAIGVGLDQPDLVVDLPVVHQIFQRCLELDPDYNRAGVEEALMALESVPEAMGGSLDRARQHFQRAVEASGGTSLTPYVSWAVTVSIARQDREEFDRMIDAALEIDLDRAPEKRLANELMRRRALYLQDHAEEYFIE